MKLALQRYWHGSDKDLLDQRKSLAREIENTLLKPFEGILPDSREDFLDTVRGGFVSKGWEQGPSVTDKQWNVVSLMDFRKDKVGIILGFDPAVSVERMLGFQKAQESKNTAIDFGIYIVATPACQRVLGRETGERWQGPDFEAVRNALEISQVGHLIKVPVCVMGIDVRDVQSIINLQQIEPTTLRELVLTFIEKKYNTIVLKNVRLKDLKERVWEFDGITRFEDRDVVFAVEVAGASPDFGSRLMTDSKESIVHLAETLEAYKEIAYRPIAARFILVGEFSSQVMKAVESACEHLTFAVDTKVDYEKYSSQEFENFLDDMRTELMT